MKKISILLSVILLTLSINVQAQFDEELLSTTGEISTTQIIDETVKKTEYKVYDRINITEPVEGSSFYLGENIKIDSTINGIGIIGAQNIDIYGDLDYGVIFGQKINIKGTIHKDAFIIGQDVIIGNDAVLNRDAFIAAKRLTISGDIFRDLKTYADVITIKSGSNIYGDIYINAKQINFESGVVINGLLEYNDDAKTNIADDILLGNVKIYENKTFVPQFNFLSVIRMFIYSLLAMIMVFIIWILVFPKTFENITKACKEPKDIVMNIVLGFGVLIVVPVGALVILIIPFAYAISLVSICIYLVLLYLSYIVTGYMIGEYGLKLLKLKCSPVIYGLSGIIVLKILCLIPGMSFLILLFGLGTLIKYIFSKKQ